MSTRSVPTLRTLRPVRSTLRRYTDHPGDVTSPENQDGEDYVNPLERSSRWVLAARALAVRSGASLGFSIFHYSDPNAPPPTKTIWLDSTLSQWKGRKAIAVDVFDPAGTSEKRKKLSSGKRLAVINFHGGGFFLGAGTDDRHWFGALNSSLDAVVFSVNYRLAPAYPFPTAVEDGADAILQICSRADELKFDRVVLSGFSAGGTLCLASWLLLQDPRRWNYDLQKPVPKIDGICLFYPGLDWSIPRHKKREICPRPDLTLPSGLTDLIDACYIYPPMTILEREDPRLSPGLMPDEFVDKLPPIHLCMCEHDMLRPEGDRFVNRLRDRGIDITARIVLGEKHAWDKPPPMMPKPSVLVEYTAAIAMIKGWVGDDGGVCGLQCNIDKSGVAVVSRRMEDLDENE